jgi:hypothetical protein
MLKEKLKIYFFEGSKHIEKIKNAKNILIKHYPFTIDTFEELSELEREGFINTQKWIVLRNAKNSILRISLSRRKTNRSNKLYFRK